jgi:hypothetical protein
MKSIFLLLSLVLVTKPVFAQQNPIHKDDPTIKAWATACQVSRGYINIADPSIMDGGTNLASYGVEDNATGIADNVIVSLGDGGTATLTFETPISNKTGYDFAIFENSFSDPTLGPPYFLELAFVEVSSDGINFFRFPATSNTQTATQIGPFETMQNSGLNNLAGKFTVYYGTPFDLEELSGTPELDINHITHIKIVDVVGCIQDEHASYDSLGNKVNDPWPTNFASSGFDLDAVAIIDQESSGINSTEKEQTLFIYPNPTNKLINIILVKKTISTVKIFNTLGQLVLSQEDIDDNSTELDISNIPNGFYIIHIETANGDTVRSSCIKR